MIPSREALYQVYSAVINEIEHSRGTQQLKNTFYSQVADDIFEACYRALESLEAAQSGLKTPKALQVVSAPMGAGKTTFALAFITALVRLSQRTPETPCACLFVVEQMAKVEEMYLDLSALLPEQVAVWSTDHDKDCKKPMKVLNPAKRFHVEELKDHAVAIVTHAFYKSVNKSKDKRKRKALDFMDGAGNTVRRALTIVDEQLDDVSIFDVRFDEVAKVLTAVQQDERSGAPVVPYVDALVTFMASKVVGSGGDLEKPTDDPSAWDGVASALAWFTTMGARDYERHNKGTVPDLGKVFGFARALASNQAFIGRYCNDGTHFVGYDTGLTLRPGMVLLDATADIDGITPLCPWRSHVGKSQARYDNLSVVHVPCYTKERLSKHFTLAKNRRKYVDWMKQVILDHMEPGQRALIVCKKALFDNCNVPDWSESDKRFNNPETYQVEYAWELDGRKLCATHWGGMGVGVSKWRDAEVVFQFGEDHRPRRVTVASTQGLMAAKATDGPLAGMRTLNSKAAHVDLLHEGRLLRSTKQMALRGNGRNFDEHGVCGRQKVVCAGSVDHYERLVANAQQLFPGAKIGTTACVSRGGGTYAEKLLTLLSTPGLPESISTTWIAEQVGAHWPDWGRQALKRHRTQACLRNLGWRYVRGTGRGGVSKFVRDTKEVGYTVVEASVAA